MAMTPAERKAYRAKIDAQTRAQNAARKTQAAKANAGIRKSNAQTSSNYAKPVAGTGVGTGIGGIAGLKNGKPSRPNLKPKKTGIVNKYKAAVNNRKKLLDET